MPMTPLPPAPLRSSPQSFANDAEVFLSALPPFATEANTLQADVNAKQVTASSAATSAQAAQAAAEAASNASIWVSGTTYAVGNVRFSPTNFLSYRRRTAGAGTTDPVSDPTNWQLLTGQGDVTTSGTQTLTNKTINGSNNTITNVSLTTGVTGALPVANGGTGATTALNAFNAIKQSAGETFAGVVELATAAEAAAGTDLSHAITSAGLRAGLNASGSAPVYACRAWVNFNGTSTVAIRASGNVSSITDNGAGDYTVNFTTSMADANYAVTITVSGGANTFNTPTVAESVAPTSSAVRFINMFDSDYSGFPVGRDPVYCSVAIFR